MNKAIPLCILLATAPSCANASLPERFEDKCSQPSNTIVLEKTKQVNKFGNPIWLLTLPDCRSYKAVVGRASTQKLNRHTANNQSPLPKGEYYVEAIHRGPFSNPEIGGTWFIDVAPMFKTQRSELGIHWDPSFNRNKKEDGTSGCIALTNSEDLDTVVDVVKSYKVEKLIVKD